MKIEIILAVLMIAISIPAANTSPISEMEAEANINIEKIEIKRETVKYKKTLFALLADPDRSEIAVQEIHQSTMDEYKITEEEIQKKLAQVKGNYLGLMHSLGFPKTKLANR